MVIKNENLKSQEHLDNIEKWTRDKKMSLNVKKMKNMIFNFSKDNQFSTEIKLNGENIETESVTKRLGTIITDKMDWNKNTQNILREKLTRE